MKKIKKRVSYHMTYSRWEGIHRLTYNFRKACRAIPEVSGMWLRFGDNDSLNIYGLLEYQVFRINDDNTESLLLESGGVHG